MLSIHRIWPCCSVDAWELQQDSPKLLPSLWIQLSMVLDTAEMPSWEEFASLYGKVGADPGKLQLVSELMK